MTPQVEIPWGEGTPQGISSALVSGSGGSGVMDGSGALRGLWLYPLITRQVSQEHRASLQKASHGVLAPSLLETEQLLQFRFVVI